MDPLAPGPALTRRALLGAGAGALLASAAACSKQAPPTHSRVEPAPAPPRASALTPDQRRLVDALADTIIPADAQSGGATDAGVGEFIDVRLGSALPAERERFAQALAAFDAISRQGGGGAFETLDSQRRVALLQQVAGDAQMGEFVAQLKALCALAYYTSEVGVLEELHYRGLRPLPVEQQLAIGCHHEDRHRGSAPSARQARARGEQAR